MRPVTLTVEGFGCYRESQEIDFSRCKVFAISGPTGAGKSSLLDAVTFALYGKIPRLGGQNLDEFISMGASRAAIRFDFDLRGERYRIARTMQRTGAKKVQLEQITGGTQKTLGDSATEVNATVTTLLGLDYEAFKQSVLLPQGEFASFLEATAGKQQQILQNLLRLDVYEKMRDRAAREERELQGQIETTQRVLDSTYALATPDELCRTEEQLVEVKKDKEVASKTHSTARAALDNLRGQWDLTKQRQAKHSRLGDVLDEEATIEELKTAIDRARKAALILPALDSFREKALAVTALETDLSKAEAKLNSVRETASACAADLQKVENEALDLPHKRARIEELSALAPVIEEHRKSKSHRAHLASELSKASTAFPSLQKSLANANRTCEEEGAKKTDLLDRKASSGFDAIAHALLKSAHRPAFELAEARRAEESCRIALEEARKNEIAAESLLLSETDKRDAVDRTHTQLKLAKAEASEHLLAMQNQDRAATLKATLVPGCMCPVCERQVEIVPMASYPTDLVAARRKLDEANAREARSQKLLEAANTAVAQATTSLEIVRKAVGDRQSQADSAAEKLESGELALRNSLSVIPVPPSVAIEDFVVTELAKFDRLHTDFQKLEADLARTLLAIQTAESKAQIAARDLKDAEADVERLANEVAAADKAIKGYAERISAAGTEDPVRETETVRAEILDIEQRQKKLAALAYDSEIKVNLAVQALADLRAQIDRAASERDQAEGTASTAISAAGFATDADVRDSTLSVAEINASELRVTNFDDEVKQLRARIADIDTQLGGAVVTETDVSTAEKAESEADEVVRRLDRQGAELAERITRLRKDTEIAERMRAEQSTRRVRHELVHQLARDLKSDAFQRHLLQGSFRRLVAGASSRLRQLNGRYELVLNENKIAVLDHDHGAQVRLADTLSGGETFLVSLSLALELSEQVQQAAGAVRLDSIFIDEGFGTLDPETLETVADAIESLGQTNRMVGVITHVAELHRRLPRLEVAKGVSGSTVRYVED